MNIIVCIKQVRHTYTRTGRSTELHYIEPEDSIYRVNPHDEAALELALGLKDTIQDSDAAIGVQLLTLGRTLAPEAVERCLAAGADGLFQITMEGPEASAGGDRSADPLDQPDPWIKAHQLARAVEELSGDLVLCGKESIDRGSGQIGALLAKLLGRPFVSSITSLARHGAENYVEVRRSAGRGVREVIRSPLPAVFSVDLGIELRFPTFARRQWAAACTPRQLAYGRGPGSPKTVSIRRFQPRPRPKIVPPPDSRLPAYERVMALLSGSKVEKKSELLTGSPQSQAEGILQFLQTHGFLKPQEHEDRDDQ